MPGPDAPRVLVVDDSSAKAEIVSALRAAGYRVTTAGTFFQAWAILSTDVPDVLITEIRLGPFNGLHLVMRVHSEHPETVAIIHTAFPDAVLEVEAGLLGAEFLVRPVLPSRLLSVVAEKLRGGRERRQTARKLLQEWIDFEIADVRAALVEVSYGGFCVHLSGDTLPSHFQLRLPSLGFSAKARIVWAQRSDEQPGRTVCGGVVTDLDESTRRAWRQVVDTV